MAAVWIEGFEHGVLSISGGGIVNSLTGAPTIDSTTKRTGGYSCRFYKTVAATCYFGKTISGSPTYLVGRIYFYFTTLPAANTFLLKAMTAAGGYPRIDYVLASQRIAMSVGGVGQQLGPVLSTGQWYRVDFRMYCGGATRTIDWAIDGVDQTQVSTAVAASTFVSLNVGSEISTTFDFYVDDIVLSATTGDYPIGAGGVKGLSPNAGGASNPGTYIQDNGSVVVNDSTNPANVELDDVPFNGADYIKQTELNTALYAEVNFADTAETTILGAQAFLAYTSATTTANDGQTRIRDSNGQETTVFSGDMSETSAFYKSAIVLTPSGGWTMAHVNALTGRVGYSSDATPNPYWQGLMIQVAYEEGGATQKSVNDAGTGSDSIDILGAIPVMDSGMGADTPSIGAAFGLDDSGAGSDVVDTVGVVPVVDSGAGAEDLALKAIIEILDSGAGSDVISAILAALAIADTGAGADGVSVDTGGATPISVADAGSGADAISNIKAIVEVLDSVSGADIVSVLAALGVMDAGSGVDIISAVAALAVVDSGAAVDAVSQVLAQIILQETGVGVDAAEIKMAITVSDAGIGVDTLLRWIVGAVVTVGAEGMKQAARGVPRQAPQGTVKRAAEAARRTN